MFSIFLHTESFNKQSLQIMRSHILNSSWIFTEKQVVLPKNCTRLAEICGVEKDLEELENTMKRFNIRYCLSDCFSFGEYLIKYDPTSVTLAPSASVSLPVAEGSLLKYAGKLYRMSNTTSGRTPQALNITGQMDLFSKRLSLGFDTLDRTPAYYAHVVGSKCHFTCNGKEYEQTLTGKGKNESGVEGYVMKSSDGLCVKIFDSTLTNQKTKSDWKKIEQMIKQNIVCDYLALPLAPVYNDRDQPIGYAMRYFENAEEISTALLHTFSDPLRIIRQILHGVLVLKSNTIVVRDLNHNILVNRRTNDACIIDIDGAQFKDMPATSLPLEENNAMPAIFYHGNMHADTIRTSYTTLYLLISAFIDPSYLFGDYVKDVCAVEQKPLEILRQLCPEVAELVERAYIRLVPVSIEEQCFVVDTLIDGGYTIPKINKADSFKSTPKGSESPDEVYPPDAKTNISFHQSKDDGIKDDELTGEKEEDDEEYDIGYDKGYDNEEDDDDDDESVSPPDPVAAFFLRLLSLLIPGFGQNGETGREQDSRPGFIKAIVRALIVLLAVVIVSVIIAKFKHFY